MLREVGAVLIGLCTAMLVYFVMWSLGLLLGWMFPLFLTAMPTALKGFWLLSTSVAILFFILIFWVVGDRIIEAFQKLVK